LIKMLACEFGDWDKSEHKGVHYDPERSEDQSIHTISAR
jgi:hypothetical protein